MTTQPQPRTIQETPPNERQRWALELSAEHYDTDRTIKVDGVYPAEESIGICDSGAHDDPRHTNSLPILIWTNNVDIVNFGCRDCLSDPRGYVRIVGAYPGDHWDIDYPDKDVSNA